jgi:hypothetical protein
MLVCFSIFFLRSSLSLINHHHSYHTPLSFSSPFFYSPSPSSSLPYLVICLPSSTLNHLPILPSLHSLLSDQTIVPPLGSSSLRSIFVFFHRYYLSSFFGPPFPFTFSRFSSSSTSHLLLSSGLLISFFFIASSSHPSFLSLISPPPP